MTANKSFWSANEKWTANKLAESANKIVETTIKIERSANKKSEVQIK
ncbi:hypothetical protein ABWK22_05275 [Gottfriedia acidiceleris]|nr:hypothetical protein [Bacillus sp. AFS001701]